MPYNIIADGSHTKKFVVNVLSEKCTFLTENGRFDVLCPLWGLTGNVRCSC